MKNIHVLPTDKPSRLYKTGGFLLLDSRAMPNNTLETKNQHIYITNDEYIGLSYYLDGDLVRKGVVDDKDYWKVRKEYKKIILTTDQDLINDGVQAIDDDFLEWFVKNPSCEEVEVESGLFFYAKGEDRRYKIIIPKEEPKQEWTPTQGEQVWIKVFSNWSSGTYIGYDTTKHIHLVRENEEGGGNLLSSSKILPYKSMPNEPKQETLEEAAEQYWAKQPYNEDAFIEGAKWQQERSYSEEEVIKIIYQLHLEMQTDKDFTFMKVDEWFKQFKKK